MPYNYFQQKAIYDQMNGTAERERQQAEMAKKKSEEKSIAPVPRDTNQLARLIVEQATGTESAPAPKEPTKTEQKKRAKKSV